MLQHILTPLAVFGSLCSMAAVAPGQDRTETPKPDTPPVSAEMYYVCVEAYCQGSPNNVFYLAGCDVDQGKATENAMQMAHDALSDCPEADHVIIILEECPVGAVCGDPEMMATAAPSAPQARVAPWKVAFQCCCCNGRTINVQATGETYCEAWQKARTFANSVSKLNGGARWCCYRIVRRPGCCVPCCCRCR